MAFIKFCLTGTVKFVLISELYNSVRRTNDSGSFRCYWHFLSKRKTSKNYLLQKYKKGIHIIHIEIVNNMFEFVNV